MLLLQLIQQVYISAHPSPAYPHCPLPSLGAVLLFPAGFPGCHLQSLLCGLGCMALAVALPPPYRSQRSSWWLPRSLERIDSRKKGWLLSFEDREATKTHFLLASSSISQHLQGINTMRGAYVYSRHRRCAKNLLYCLHTRLQPIVDLPRFRRRLVGGVGVDEVHYVSALGCTRC